MVIRLIVALTLLGVLLSAAFVPVHAHPLCHQHKGAYHCH